MIIPFLGQTLGKPIRPEAATHFSAKAPGFPTLPEVQTHFSAKRPDFRIRLVSAIPFLACLREDRTPPATPTPLLAATLAIQIQPELLAPSSAGPLDFTTLTAQTIPSLGS